MKPTAYLDSYTLIRIYNAYPGFCDGLELRYDGHGYSYEINEVKDHLELIFNEIDPEKKISIQRYNESCQVEYRLISHTDKFEKDYCPDVYSLGAFYTKKRTFFRFWAPFKDEVELVVSDVIYPMEKKEKGIFEYTLEGDHELEKYHYIMVKDGLRIPVLDPYAYVKTFSDIDSVIIDTNKIDRSKAIPDKCEQPIIYETSVRDFSSYDGLFDNPGKFAAFKEKGLKLYDRSIGTDYLKELGITHLQLMPVLDYDNDKTSYNWGYNPVNYNYFKDEYLINEGGYEQIEEVQSVIRYLHLNNIRVILDVVFNHVYSTGQFIFHKILPYYFYRYEDDRKADGSGLGNELRTESRFMSEYLVMLMKRLVDIYDIDGLRYDLSGLVDIDTIKRIHNECSRDKDFITISEGWVMGSALKDKACNYLNAKCIPESKFFNSFFRETLRGNNEYKGYLMGNESLREEFKKAFMASSVHLDLSQTVNYTECHDDATSCDWYFRKCSNEPFELVKKRLMLNIASTILAKGTPFIHSGQEFFRTKNGIDNTYNKPDEINHLSWYRRLEYADVTEYTKNLIEIRKKLSPYYEKEWKVSDYYEMIVFEVDDLKIFINNCPFHHIYTDGNSYETLFDGNRCTSLYDQGINVNEYSCVIAIKQL